jgi:hypothetical protein
MFLKKLSLDNEHAIANFTTMHELPVQALYVQYNGFIPRQIYNFCRETDLICRSGLQMLTSIAMMFCIEQFSDSMLRENFLLYIDSCIQGQINVVALYQCTYFQVH